MLFSQMFAPIALALAAGVTVSAQTWSACNPLAATCPANPAFGGKLGRCNFTKGKCSTFKNLPGTTVRYNKRGAELVINKEGDSPTIQTDKYIFFGRVDFVLQAAKGQGIVTSVVLLSDDLDEIDFEWVGGNNAQVQSNYFSKGDTSTYDRAAYHHVNAPLTKYHKYSIKWTPSAITWLVDDTVVRTLTYAEAKGGQTFPQTPMRVKLGTWVGGSSNSSPGTVQWAGGYTDFKKAPFKAFYKSIRITDYAGKSGPSKDTRIKEYVYGDKSGRYQSIVVKRNGQQ